jgi:uncharacterized protein
LHDIADGTLLRPTARTFSAKETPMSTAYHEPNLSEHARDLHRALASTIEELEAIDWYQQRIDATNDEALAAILAHNRDEEIEHMAMGLEWLRRKMPVMDEMLRTNHRQGMGDPRRGRP